MDNKTRYKIFKKGLENKSKNKDLVLSIMFKNITSNTADYLLDLLYSDEEAIVFSKGDYIKTPIDTYHAKTYFNYDTLLEMGLLCTETNSVYGRIVDDGSWSSDFDPHYGQMKVDLLYHDDDGNIFKHQATLNTASLIRVNKKDIKHFKFTENGNDKSPSIKNRDKELGNTEENVLQTST